jgi:hypothetical protein
LDFVQRVKAKRSSCAHCKISPSLITIIPSPLFADTFDRKVYEVSLKEIHINAIFLENDPFKNPDDAKEQKINLPYNHA